MIVRPRYHLALLALFAVVSVLPLASGAAVFDDGYTNTTFHKGTYTDLFALEETADQGLLIGGLAYGGGTSNALLMRLDAGRNEVWTRSFEGDSVADIAPAPGGDWYTGVYTVSFTYAKSGGMNDPTGNATLMRIDPDGSIVWQTRIPDARIAAIEPGPGGDALVTGWTWGAGTNTTAFLSRFDSSGNEVWTRTLRTGAAHDLVVDEDGACTIAGAHSPLTGGETGGWVVATDPQGEIVRQTGYSDRSAFTLLPLSGGDMLVGGSTAPYHSFMGRAWVARQDAAGSIEWSTLLGGVAVYDGVAVNGEYVFVGKWGDFPQMQILDEDGNILGETIFEGLDGRLNVVEADGQGGFTAAGWSRVLGQVDGWLMDTGEAGTPTPTIPPSTSLPTQTGAPTTTPASPGFSLWAAGIAVAGIALLLCRAR